MRRFTVIAFILLLGLSLPASQTLANGAEIDSKLDDVLNASKVAFTVRPAAPKKGQTAEISVTITHDGKPVHDAWVELLFMRQGGKGMGDLVKCKEKGKGTYVGTYAFDKAGTYDVEVSGNYVPMSKHRINVGN
jgi:hypothetical protein